MIYVKKSGPPEERDFDPVVPCPRKFREIEEFSDTRSGPEEELLRRESVSEVLAKNGLGPKELPILCSSCDERAPNCPNCSE